VLHEAEKFPKTKQFGKQRHKEPHNMSSKPHRYLFMPYSATFLSAALVKRVQCQGENAWYR